MKEKSFINDLLNLGSTVQVMCCNTFRGKLLVSRKLHQPYRHPKTVEGFVGGVLSASLLGMLLHWLTPFNAWQAFLMSLLICLMGFLGGLVMSAMKRSMGVKDWGI